jgi:UDP-glucose 4-epimerase
MTTRAETAVIVGGNGFIGSNLASALRKDGIELTVVDQQPPPPELEGKIEFVHADIADSDLECIPENVGTLFLLAAQLAKACSADPIRGWGTNVVGTARILDRLSRRSPGTRVVFTSTGGIYAPAETYPVAETAELRPKGLYALSKAIGEEMVRSFAQAHGRTATILRFFTVYGPGPATGSRGHMVANLIERAETGAPLLIHGDGSQTVDLTHVSDVVGALRGAMRLKLHEGAAPTFNIGSGRETTVQEVAHLIKRHWPSAAIQFQPEMAGYGPRRQLGDISRARAEFGYLPEIDPATGIARLAKHRQARVDEQ